MSCMVAVDDAIGRQRLPRGRLGPAPRAAAHRRRRAASAPTSSTPCDWDPVRGAGRGDALVPLRARRTAAAQPSSDAAAGALPDVQRAARGRPASALLPRRSSPSSRPRIGPEGGCRCRSSATSRGGRSHERATSVDEVLRALRAVGAAALRRGAQPARARAADRRARRAGRCVRRADRRRAAPRRRPPARAAGRRCGASSRSTAATRSPAPGTSPSLFPAEVTAPIALHVAAKRYLCAVDPAYHASALGGFDPQPRAPGRPDDRRTRSPRSSSPTACEDAVALRRWDDLGKVDGLDVGSFDRHLPRLACAAAC